VTQVLKELSFSYGKISVEKHNYPEVYSISIIREKDKIPPDFMELTYETFYFTEEELFSLMDLLRDLNFPENKESNDD